MSSSRIPCRRTFLATGSAAVAATTLAGEAPRLNAARVHNSVNDKLRIGLVGCGGRRTQTVINALRANDISMNRPGQLEFGGYLPEEVATPGGGSC